jgi:hypothetical protein
MADAVASPFVMHGARDAMSRGMMHIERQITSIELAIVENPAWVFDLAKTLVESVCKTVLGERGVPFAEDDDLPRLFRSVSLSLPFLPPTASAEADVRRSLAQTLGGLSTTVQGICELRNQCGFASHGSSSARPAMETVQALLAAQAADAIVGFLYRIHRQNRIAPSSPRQLYEDSSAFNASIDEMHGTIRIYNEEFQPSRVLFELAPEPYRLYLAEFETEGEKTDSEDLRDGAEEVPS